MSLQPWQCLAATGIEAEVTTEEGHAGSDPEGDTDGSFYPD